MIRSNARRWHHTDALLRGLLLVLLISGLSACNQVRFFYDRADWLVERWVDGKLDPTGPQLAQWRPVLAAGLERHREDELPVLVEFLGAVAQRAAEGFARPATTCLFDMADRVYRRHARLAVEVAVPLLSAVKEKQIDHLEASLAAEIEEYREDYLAVDPRERAAERAKRFTRRIERWTGRLDKAQRELVAAGTGGIPDVASEWLDYRLAREAALLGLLRGGADADELRQFLTDSWVDLKGRSPTLKDQMDRMRRQTIEFLVALDEQLSAAQRQRFVERISGLREDLAEAVPDEGMLRTTAVPADACVSAS
jgi:hypothetical protein